MMAPYISVALFVAGMLFGLSAETEDGWIDVWVRLILCIVFAAIWPATLIFILVEKIKNRKPMTGQGGIK